MYVLVYVCMYVLTELVLPPNAIIQPSCEGLYLMVVGLMDTDSSLVSNVSPSSFVRYNLASVACANNSWERGEREREREGGGGGRFQVVFNVPLGYWDLINLCRQRNKLWITTIGLVPFKVSKCHHMKQASIAKSILIIISTVLCWSHWYLPFNV